MNFGVISALATYMLVSSFTPGPGNILTLTSMTNYGWKKENRLFSGFAQDIFAFSLFARLLFTACRSGLSRR